MLGRISTRAVWLLAALAAGPAWLGAGCSSADAEPSAGLMLAIRSDMAIPDDIASMRIEITTAGVVRHASDYALGPAPDKTSLPGTLMLLPSDDPSMPVRIRIVAHTVSGEAVVVREAVTTVPSDRVALLPLGIQWLCLGDTGCTQDERTCVAGACASVNVDSAKLPDFDPALVFGGAPGPGSAGTCFDTTQCFSAGSVVPVDTTDCSLDPPAPGTEAKLNVALVLPFAEKHGICGSDACLIPLDRDAVDGYEIGPSGRVMLPSAVCKKLGQSVDAVAVSTSCDTKTASTPTCGPWSSVTSKPGEFDASGPTVSGDAGVDASSDASDAIADTDAFVPPPADPNLGKSCTQSSECGTLSCLTAGSGELGGSAPLGGLCTRSCAGQPAGYCDFVSPGARCLALNGPGTEHCVEACTPGPVADAGPSKCHGRDDMACAQRDFGGAPSDVCVPTCKPVDVCLGMTCSPITLLCGPTPPGTYVKINTDCGIDGGVNPDAGGPSCSGYCASLENPSTQQETGKFCTYDCVIGADNACGYVGVIATAGCFKNGKPSQDYGDQGQCIELCDCNNACTHPGMVCTPLADSALVQYYQRPAYCTHPIDELGMPVEILTCS